MEKAKKRKKLEQYLKRFTKDRKTSFKCPKCINEIVTIKPDSSDEIFDSVECCSDCDALFFKKVNAEGKVEVILL